MTRRSPFSFARPLTRGLVLGALTFGSVARASAAESSSPAALTKLPKQLKFVEATYPPAAASAGIEADVILDLTIDVTGHVDHAAVATSAGPGREDFDTAALAAAKEYLFEPAESQGKPVAVTLNYKVKFRLKAKPGAAPAPDEVASAAFPGDANTGTASQTLSGSSAATPSVAPAPAPRESFAGALQERGRRLPVIGAIVTITKEGGPPGAPAEAFEDVTDANGHFTFYDLPPGTWRVDVETAGFFPFHTAEDVRSGEKTVVTYYVERGQASALDETVTASRPKKDVTHVVLAAEVIDRVPGTAGDPLAVVQNLAGVNRAPAGSGEIIVRGSAPEDTQLFVDGTDVPLVYHFGGLRSVLPVGVIQNIEFIPGNFSSEYGRATGGIIDVHLKPLKPKRFGGYVDVSILDTGVYLEAPLGDRGGIAIAGRRSYLDAILKAAVPSDAPVNLVTAPVYYDYQLLANYKVSSSHDVRAMFFGSDDKLALLFKNPADFTQHATGNQYNNHTTFWRALAADHYAPNETVENTLRVSVGRDDQDLNFGDLVFKLKRDVMQVRDTFRLKVAPWLTFVAGTDTTAENYRGHVRLPPPPNEGQPMGNFDLGTTKETRLSGEWRWLPAAFAELELRPTKPLLVSLGLRADRFQFIEQTTLAPRLSARYDFDPRWAVKGALGLYHQMPNPEETDPGFGNPRLKAERAIHAALGGEWHPWAGTTFDVTGFYKRLSSLVGPTDANRLDNGMAVPLVYANNARGRVVGLELLARQDFTAGFVGWVAYTLSRSERQDEGRPGWRLFDFDQTHILTAVGSYDLPRHWKIASRFRYVSGNPTTPVVGSVFNNVNDEYDPVFGKVNSARQPAFYQLDVRLDKQWVFDRWLLDAYVDLQNATNHTNPEGVAYSYDFTQAKVNQGLPILTFLGLRAEF